MIRGVRPQCQSVSETQAKNMEVLEMLETKQDQVDLKILPEEAKKEILDFYKFLLQKYQIKTHKRTKDDIDNFFDQYNLDFSCFIFDREKIHER